MGVGGWRDLKSDIFENQPKASNQKWDTVSLSGRLQEQREIN